MLSLNFPMNNFDYHFTQEFLNLSRNDSVDDDVLGQIVSHCTKLRYVILHCSLK